MAMADGDDADARRAGGREPGRRILDGDRRLRRRAEAA